MFPKMKEAGSVINERRGERISAIVVVVVERRRRSEGGGGGDMAVK